MALRILLADDSMTAQNMGKKILSEGGYEVIAVSNGAAALKKIAEQKPDVVVLDIYMPGYSGLEVCERLKNTIETSRVPVLLTVGKLEPFRPEDAVRVRAEGVIIKPFEASELLAVIEKAASHVVKHVPVPQPEPEEFPEEEDFTQQMGASVAALEEIEVPKDVADGPAFGLDEMVSAISTSAPDAEKIPKFEALNMDDFETRVSEEDEPSVASASVVDETVQHEVEAATKDQAESEFETESPASFTSAGGDPLLESRDNSGPVNATLESEVFFDNPDPGEVLVARDPNLWVDDSTAAVARLPELEVTAQREAEPVDAVTDPALIARENLMAEVTTFPEKYREIDDDLICESEAQVDAEAATVEAEKPAPAEDDFDALVSAALAKFEPEADDEVEQEPAVATGAWRAEATSLDQSERSVSLEREMQIALAVASGAGFSVPASPAVMPAAIGSSTNGNGVGMLEVHEAPVVEEEIAEVPEAAVAVEELAVEGTPQATAELDSQFPEPITPEATLPEIAAPQLSEAAVAGAMLGQVVGQPKDSLEQERLVEAIGRVLERLKPQIVSELAKELKSRE